MIELNYLTLFLLLETLAALILVLVTVFWIITRRGSRETRAVKKLIDRLAKAGDGQSHELGEILKEIQTLPDDKRRDLVATIQALEKTLYHQIVKLFLQRDILLLGKIGDQIRDLSKPYHDLLRELPPREDPVLADTLDKAEEEIGRLKIETEQLANQLQVAMATIDDLSSEYTRMFAPDKTREEMEASRQKILDTLKQSEKHLEQSPAAAKEEEEDDDDLVITLVDSP